MFLLCCMRDGGHPLSSGTFPSASPSGGMALQHAGYSNAAFGGSNREEQRLRRAAALATSF